MEFVALVDAKFHLHEYDPIDDPEITKYVARASGAIWDYLKPGPARPDEPWTAENAPEVVQAATLLFLAHLWEHRGDDLAPDTHDVNVWDAIARLLMRSRDPALA